MIHTRFNITQYNLKQKRWIWLTFTMATAKEAGMKEKAIPTIIDAENASKS